MTQTCTPLNQRLTRWPWRKTHASRWLKFLFLLLLTCFILIGLPQPSWGQLSVPGLGNTNTTNPPPNVIRRGDIEITPVSLDGNVLFLVTAPTVRDRSNPGDLVPVEMRAELIDFSLRNVLSSTEVGIPNFDLIFSTQDPNTIQVGVATLNNETIISARTNELQNPQKILTVTETDSRFYGQSIPELAENWRERIQIALRDAVRDRSPQALKGYLQTSLKTLLGLVALSIGLYLLQRFVKARLKDLKAEFEVAHAELDPGLENPDHAPSSSPSLQSPTHNPKTLNHWLKNSFSSPRLYLLDKRIKIVSLVLFLLTWGQVAIWLIGGFYIFNLFPWTRDFAWRFLGLPISWLLIWFLSGLVNSLGDLALKRVGQIWHKYPLRGDTDLQRRSLRIGTALTVLGGLKTTIVYGVALSLVVGSLGIPIGSVIAVGGLVAFALSLGAQSLVRDLINGTFILWEDQFGIGDVVSINAVSGVVENMNLRITQLRNGEGRLITIPNSAITIVENLTRTWSRVDFTVDIDSQARGSEALALLRQVAMDFYQDQAWQQKMLDPPEVLGIDRISHSGLTIRVWLKTQPGEQWAVGREFRLRVQQALDEAQISIGRPQQVLWKQEA